MFVTSQENNRQEQKMSKREVGVMIKTFSETISTGDSPTSNLPIEEFSKKKSSFQVLKENKIPLTKEERDIVMKKKAVWHHGPHGEESPAVWKSKNSKGEIVYIVNTHRAYNKAPTLLGAIERYHKFIKMTASE